MSRGEWVSLPDIGRLEEVTEGEISHNMTLPVGANEERLQLHPSRLQRLAATSGAISMFLTFDAYAGRPNFVDTMHIGGGVAVLKGLKKDAPETGSFSFTGTFGQYERQRDPAFEIAVVTDRMFRSGAVTLQLSRNELTDRVMRDKANQRGPLDERLWAKHLNVAIKNTTRAAAKGRYNAEARSFFQSKYFTGAIIDTGFPLAITSSMANDFEFIGTYPWLVPAGWLVMTNAIAKLVASATDDGYPFRKESPFSLLPFSGAEKYPLAVVKTRTMGRVVRCLA